MFVQRFRRLRRSILVVGLILYVLVMLFSGDGNAQLKRASKRIFGGKVYSYGGRDFEIVPYAHSIQGAVLNKVDSDAQASCVHIMVHGDIANRQLLNATLYSITQQSFVDVEVSILSEDQRGRDLSVARDCSGTMTMVVQSACRWTMALKAGETFSSRDALEDAMASIVAVENKYEIVALAGDEQQPRDYLSLQTEWRNVMKLVYGGDFALSNTITDIAALRASLGNVAQLQCAALYDEIAQMAIFDRRISIISGRISQVGHQYQTRLKLIDNRIAEDLLNKRPPLVSVIIPYYNSGIYAQESFEALSAQSFSDLEIIIVDDGSSNRERQLLDASIQSTLSNWNVRVVSQQNRGLSYARNIGALHAKGEFIIFFDPDDLINATTIEKLALKLCEHKDATYIFPGSVHFGEFNQVILKEFDRKKLLEENYLPSFAMVNRQDYIMAGGMDETFNGWEDYDFWLRLLGENKHGKLLNEKLFFYRRHKNGMTGKIISQKLNSDQLKEQLIKRNAKAYGQQSNAGAGHKIKRLDQRYYQKFNVSLSTNVQFGGHIDDRDVTFPSSPVYDYPSLSMRNLRQPKTQDVINVLYMIPYMTVGGAEQVDIDVIHALATNSKYGGHQKFRVTVVTEDESKVHVWEDRFSPWCHEIFHLGKIANGWQSSMRLVEYLIYSRAIDVVFVRNNYLGYNIARKFKQDYNSQVKFIDLIHLYAIHAAWDGYSVDYHKFLDSRVLISDDLHQYMQDKFRLPADDFTVIYNGIDLDQYNKDKISVLRQVNLRKKLGIPAKSPIVAFVGRVDEQKDPEKWMRIAAHIQRVNNAEIHFVVIGNGDKMPIMQSLELSLEIQRVHFVGHVDHVEHYLVDVDVLLITSIYEGVPFTAIYAASLGIPIVASRVGGIAEVVYDGENGKLLDVKAPIDAYAKAVSDTINMKVDQQVIKKVRSKFDISIMRSRYVELFTSVASGIDQTKLRNERMSKAFMEAIGSSEV
ncbi:hypothetical protein MP228_010630 [Amoeboaphelidium protococcarum]|nr:hypothetical protein MP228_010630 [Amoeboaphelidium protococcarum]